MTAIVAKDGMDFVMLASLSTAGIVPGARSADQSAPATPSFAARLAAGVKWLAELPRRNAVVAELSALSDHELADIGLSRPELNRVFDTKFAIERQALRG